jgi:hypothetical protein
MKDALSALQEQSDREHDEVSDRLGELVEFKKPKPANPTATIGYTQILKSQSVPVSDWELSTYQQDPDSVSSLSLSKSRSNSRRVGVEANDSRRHLTPRLPISAITTGRNSDRLALKASPHLSSDEKKLSPHDISNEKLISRSLVNWQLENCDNDQTKEST